MSHSKSVCIFQIPHHSKFHMSTYTSSQPYIWEARGNIFSHFQRLNKSCIIFTFTKNVRAAHELQYWWPYLCFAQQPSNIWFKTGYGDNFMKNLTNSKYVRKSSRNPSHTYMQTHAAIHLETWLRKKLHPFAW